VERISEITDGGWVGKPVIDEASRPVGKVVDVLYDDDTSRTPQWAVVGVGFFRSQHYVPLAEAYKTHDGRLVVPYDQRVVKQSPKATREHIMTPNVREATASHYGVPA